MSEFLEKCPFCGSEAKIGLISKDWYVVRCQKDNCNAQLGKGRTTEKGAIGAWNRRVRDE